MHPLVVVFENRVENFVLVFSVGLAKKSFYAVAVDRVFEKSFSNTNNQLICRIFFCNRFNGVKTFDGMTEKFLLFLEKVFDLDFRTESFVFGKRMYMNISVFW